MHAYATPKHQQRVHFHNDRLFAVYWWLWRVHLFSRAHWSQSVGSIMNRFMVNSRSGALVRLEIACKFLDRCNIHRDVNEQVIGALSPPARN